MVSQRSNIKGERPWKTWLSKRPQGLWFREGGILGLRAFWRTHKHIMTILLWVLLYPWFPHSTRKKKLFQKFIYFRSSWFSPILILIPNFFFPSCSSNQKCVYICTMCTNRWGKIFSHFGVQIFLFKGFYFFYYSCLPLECHGPDGGSMSWFLSVCLWFMESKTCDSWR